LIPMELWMDESMAKRRANAVAKALREKPTVKQVEPVLLTTVKNLYYVNQYHVTTEMDADDRMYIECSCAAGSPPLEDTGLPSREAAPCYHAAAVLIHIAEQEKTNE
jgi:hypothetical protein